MPVKQVHAQLPTPADKVTLLSLAALGLAVHAAIDRYLLPSVL